jgi:hypothetical protein
MGQTIILIVRLKLILLELEDNPNYYDTDWGFLIVGLQAIIINQNYTVVRSVYIPPAD